MWDFKNILQSEIPIGTCFFRCYGIMISRILYRYYYPGVCDRVITFQCSSLINDEHGLWSDNILYTTYVV